MPQTTVARYPIGISLFVGLLSVSLVSAQSVCEGSLLGQGGQEVCVTIAETIPGGASINRRGPSGFRVNEVVGAYTVDLAFSFSSASTGGGTGASIGGMAVTITGTVTRTSPGNGGLSVTADGGLRVTTDRTPFNGAISLVGSATGITNTEVGGGAGFLVGNDVQFVSLGLVTCSFGTQGPGGILCEKDELPIQTSEPLVAVRNITGFHINEVGVTIDVPTAAAVGDPGPGGDGESGLGYLFCVLDGEVIVPTTTPAGSQQRDLYICPEGHPEIVTEQQVHFAGPDACSVDHIHFWGGLATSLSGLLLIDPNPVECGVGPATSAIAVDINEIEGESEQSRSSTVAPGGVFVIGPGGSFINGEGLNINVANGGSLITGPPAQGDFSLALIELGSATGGQLEINGQLNIGPEGSFDNAGHTTNNGNTINNYGTLNNTGTLVNNGTINNLCGGVINNTGTMTGNAVNEVPCSLYFAQFGDGMQGGNFLNSRISLLNPNTGIDATATILFRDSAGQPLTVDINGETVDGELQISIPAGAVRQFSTDGQGMIQAGSVTVNPDVLLDGVIIFESNAGLAGVPSSQPLPNGFLASMDTDPALGINTGVAIVNLEERSVTLDLQLFDSDRNVLSSASSELPAVGQLARFVSDFDWDPEIDFASFSGILKVTANGRLAATVILLRPGQFATLPVTPR